MLRRGFRFYLDDFGVGYSNAAAVAKYRFEYIKLDKSLVGEIATDDRSRLLVRNLIHMFRDLGMGVIAEGVETAEQLACLTELDVEKIQGFYYAKPMDGQKLIGFLRGYGAGREQKAPGEDLPR